MAGSCPQPKPPGRTVEPRVTARWKALAAVGSALAQAFAVLWLGITLTSGTGSVAFAVVKIIFVIAVVLSAAAGIRWATAAGSALLLEALAVATWIALRVEAYPPHGALRTALMLALPLAASGVLLILADGVRAGTWPPARFRDSTRGS